MFAPYCPTCRRRVLLSTDRIVRYTSTGGRRHVVVLRCDCDDLVDWDQQPPAEPVTPVVAAGRRLVRSGHQR